MASPRFVVRELTGWAIRPGRTTRRSAPRSLEGRTVWVADEAFHGREVRIWRSEDYGSMWDLRRTKRMRDAAHALADELNAQEAAT